MLQATLRQAIWEHKQGLPAMEALASEVVELQKHYRIGLNICRFADRILPPGLGELEMKDGCCYDEKARPSSIRTIGCVSNDDQFAQCLADLKRQLRYISDEPIMVLSQSQKARDAFWALWKPTKTFFPNRFCSRARVTRPLAPTPS